MIYEKESASSCMYCIYCKAYLGPSCGLLFLCQGIILGILPVARLYDLPKNVLFHYLVNTPAIRVCRFE